MHTYPGHHSILLAAFGMLFLLEKKKPLLVVGISLWRLTLVNWRLPLHQVSAWIRSLRTAGGGNGPEKKTRRSTEPGLAGYQQLARAAGRIILKWCCYCAYHATIIWALHDNDEFEHWLVTHHDIRWRARPRRQKETFESMHKVLFPPIYAYYCPLDWAWSTVGRAPFVVLAPSSSQYVLHAVLVGDRPDDCEIDGQSTAFTPLHHQPQYRPCSILVYTN